WPARRIGTSSRPPADPEGPTGALSLHGAMRPETLAAATGCTLLTAARWLPHIEAAMAKHGINTAKRQAHFLAQVSHESTRLSVLEENLSYSVERIKAVWPNRFPTLGQA